MHIKEAPTREAMRPACWGFVVCSEIASEFLYSLCDSKSALWAITKWYEYRTSKHFRPPSQSPCFQLLPGQ